MAGGVLSAGPRPRVAASPFRAQKQRKNAALAALVTALAATGLLVVCYRSNFPRIAQGASGRSLASRWPEDDDDDDPEQSFILDACLNLQSEIAYEGPAESAIELGSREQVVAGILASIQEEASRFTQSVLGPLPHQPTVEYPRELGYYPFAPRGLLAGQSGLSLVPPAPAQEPFSRRAGPSGYQRVTTIQQQATLPAPAADPQGLAVTAMLAPEWSHQPALQGPSTSIGASEGYWGTSSSGDRRDEAQQVSSFLSFQRSGEEAYATPQSSSFRGGSHLFFSQHQTLQPEPLPYTVQYSEDILGWQQAALSSSSPDPSTPASAHKNSGEDPPRPPEYTGEQKRPEKRKSPEGDSSAVVREEKTKRIRLRSSDEDEPAAEGTESPRSPSPHQPSVVGRVNIDDLKAFFSTPSQLQVERGLMIIRAPQGAVYTIPHPPERMRPGAHPFYSLPVLRPGALTRGLDLSAVLRPSPTIKAPLRSLKRVQGLLKKEVLEANEAQVLVSLTESLVRYLVLRHRSRLPIINPSLTADRLGMRFMCLEAIVCLMQLLGPAISPHLWWDPFVRWVPTEYNPLPSQSRLPRAAEFRELCIRLSYACKRLKRGLRLSEEDTVQLKRDLLTTQAPTRFKESKWDAWRLDDILFRQGQQ
ncbi:hypothetical protein ACSSS7_003216 [Eimeria intestinalis]